MAKNIEVARQIEGKKFSPEEIFNLACTQIPAYLANTREFSHIDEFYKDELTRAIRVFFLEIGYARPSERILSSDKQKMFDILFNYFILPENKRPKINDYIGQTMQKKFDFK